MLRDFLVLEAEKEIEKQRLLLNIAMATIGGGNKEWSDDLSAHFNTYVSRELGLETSVQKEVAEVKDNLTIDYYNKVKNMPVTARKKVGAGGKAELVIEGILDLEKI